MTQAFTDFFNTIGDFFIDLSTNILHFCYDMLCNLLMVIFGWINIPAIPDSIRTSISSFLELVFSNSSIVGFFIRIDTLKILIPLLIVVINFEYIYKFTMWIVKKLPFLNLK